MLYNITLSIKFSKVCLFVFAFPQTCVALPLKGLHLAPCTTHCPDELFIRVSTPSTVSMSGSSESRMGACCGDKTLPSTSYYVCRIAVSSLSPCPARWSLVSTRTWPCRGRQFRKSCVLHLQVHGRFEYSCVAAAPSIFCLTRARMPPVGFRGEFALGDGMINGTGGQVTL